MSDSLLNRITINSEVAHGKPTIRNKRYTVEGMLEYMAGGDSVDDLLKEFPFIKIIICHFDTGKVELIYRY